MPRVCLVVDSAGPKPFQVMRSRMGNFPIYTDVRNGGSKVVTVLRKYTGDVDALKAELQASTPLACPSPQP